MMPWQGTKCCLVLTFPQNLQSQFQLFNVFFHRTLDSSSRILMFFDRTSGSILDTIFHISRPLVLGSLENYSSAVWFQTGFDSTYLHITHKIIFFLFTSTISPIKCDHLYETTYENPQFFLKNCMLETFSKSKELHA